MDKNSIKYFEPVIRKFKLSESQILLIILTYI